MLHVGRLRPDGFHDLTTVYTAVGLHDEVDVTAADGLAVTVEGEGAADVPTDATNLAARAATLLAEHVGRDPDVHLHLRKGIPVAGGCAGGSADAAAALVACDALWGTGLTKDDLDGLAAQLGSDVPFSLHGGTALGTGRGERLTPVLGHGPWSWVLALSDGGLSTPEVYAELDRQREQGPVGVAGDPATALQAVRSGDPVLLGRALHNDLQPAALALRPQLGEVLEAGRALGALGAVVSGSGPTVALLARDPAGAAEIASALTARGVCRAARAADGPVAGARVVEVA